MIYLMLDTSGSMNNFGSMVVDYDHTYKGKVCTDKLIDVGKNNGSYDKDGKFVGVGKGKYDKKEECSLESTASNRTCGYTTNWFGNVTWTNILTLPDNLSVPGTVYKYGLANTDYYCAIDLDLITENTVANNTYKSKISNICDRIGTTNKYNCYSRIVKLRQGLLNLVNDSSIDENVSFALGQYPTSSSNNNPKTRLNFMAMTAANKVKISNEIAGLTASGGTPISPAYGTAATDLLSKISGTASTGASLECTGKGVYFLTDGEPTTSYGEGSFTTILTNNSIASKNTKSLGNTYWGNIQKFAESLKESKYKIKTATVGFGGEYYLPASAGAEVNYETKTYYDCSKLSGNQQQLCEWGAKKIPKAGYEAIGGLGEGGFYNAQSSAELLKSVKSFLNEVTPDIEGTTMGSSTIPVDALNTSELQPYAYFPMFKPLIGTEDQLWMGNLKKFNVSKGSLFDVKANAVFKNAADFNPKLQDYWYNASGKNADNYLSYGGSLSQLQAKMQVIANGSAVTLKRNLLIDIGDILQPVSQVLAASGVTDREYLYGLMGYSSLTAENLAMLKSKSYTDQLAYLNSLGAPKADYQLGSVIHSTPLLLTQKGVVEYADGAYTSVDREDYILFGTTQGVLHVLKAGQQKKQSFDGSGVDAAGGEEVFAFVPQEMLSAQKKGFVESLAMSRSKSKAEGGGFYYGIDGQWVAHTVYEPSIYQAAKLDANGNKVLDKDNKEIFIQREGLQVKAKSDSSHQYVYGGLRMGGRSYYGLNLSDMNDPKLLFRINPADHADGPLSYMGESWSKPTITYINWNGKKKLVMIVGGGYDEKYETPTFSSAKSGDVKGNGIYIFDAVKGDLLWWASSAAKTTNALEDGTPASSQILTMIDSIPSRIKAVDRDGDGISDHLYVGDLGGRVFRVDLNSKHKISTKAAEVQPFILNAFEMAKLRGNTAKTPPRFYEAPTFTIHKVNSTNMAVITLASGDRSSPLVTDTANNNQDMIVGLFDNGVTQTVPVAETSSISLSNLQQIYPTSTAPTVKKGWYYLLPVNTDSVDTAKKYQSKGFSEGVALANDLYYSVFDPRRSTTGTSSATSCTGGIIGESTAYKLCLPNGICDNATAPIAVGGLGAGIIALNIGPGETANSRTLVLNNKGNTTVLDEYSTKSKLLPRRWFEYSPYTGK